MKTKPTLFTYGKPIATILWVMMLSFTTVAQDLPGNTAPNIQSAPAGSIIIAMDNTNQANGSGLFNLKAYGLIVTLLYHQYNLKWVIRTGKIHDDIDFSVLSERVTPSYALPAIRNFRSSAIVVFPADTAGIYGRILLYNNSIAASGDRVRAYRTTVAVNVDVRYNINRMPRVAVLSDGANSPLHISYMTASNIPAANYSVFSALNLANDCFTFASEPHLEGSGPYLDAVRNYVNAGGNFLAQCYAVETYENPLSGRYQSSTGMTTVNASVSTVTYPAADMPFAQIHGAYNPNYFGAINNWTFASGGAQMNNAYKVIGSSSNSAIIGASVSKVGTGAGGLVFYIGNHVFYPLDNNTMINGVRMYMNAMLIPSSFSCNPSIWSVLPIRLNSFDLIKKSETYTRLSWTASEEHAENAWYIMEHSLNGKDFVTLKKIPARNIGEQTYEYQHNGLAAGKNYYRLRIEEVDGHISYSRTMEVINYAEKEMSIFPNPAVINATITFAAKKNIRYSVQVTDLTGRMVKMLPKQTVDNIIQLPVHDLRGGTYLVRIAGSDGSSYQQKLLVEKK